MSKQNLEQTQTEKSMSFPAVCAQISFFGGVFWSAMGQLAHYLNFSEFGPAFFLRSWISAKWTKGSLGVILSILLLGILSVGVGYLYALFLKKKQSSLYGMAFGIAIWAIVFLLLYPIFPGMEKVTHWGENSIITTFCLFLLYGLFVGYSISFEYMEQKRQKQNGANQTTNDVKN